MVGCRLILVIATRTARACLCAAVLRNLLSRVARRLRYARSQLVRRCVLVRVGIASNARALFGCAHGRNFLTRPARRLSCAARSVQPVAGVAGRALGCVVRGTIRACCPGPVCARAFLQTALTVRIFRLADRFVLRLRASGER